MASYSDTEIAVHRGHHLGIMLAVAFIVTATGCGLLPVTPSAIAQKPAASFTAMDLTGELDQSADTKSQTAIVAANSSVPGRAKRSSTCNSLDAPTKRTLPHNTGPHPVTFESNYFANLFSESSNGDRTTHVPTPIRLCSGSIYEPPSDSELSPTIVRQTAPAQRLSCTNVEPDFLPGDPDNCLSFCNDVRTSSTWLSKDIQSLATIENAMFLSAAAGGALMLQTHVDGQVQQSVSAHGSYWGFASDFLNSAGEPIVQAPLLAGLYAYSLYEQDPELHDLALTFAASYKISTISALVLQYATNTRHGHYGALNMLTDNGFPSIPAATSFTLAAVVDEKFGWKAAIPAYLTAGLIGWSGIDQSQHRVSDVVFGAALGYVIGKSIASLHYRPNATWKLTPFVDGATHSQGLGIEKQF